MYQQGTQSHLVLVLNICYRILAGTNTKVLVFDYFIFIDQQLFVCLTRHILQMFMFIC